jgi:glycolate oxidase iron-sulfur subunit
MNNEKNPSYQDDKPAQEQAQQPRIGFSGKDIPDREKINACVHCGLCLASCPTYRETGLEMSSPRGRIYLMKAVSEGQIGLESEVFQAQMYECLNCRACEAVCPSGVLYGSILEASRAQIEQARQRGAVAPPSPPMPSAAGLDPRPWWQRTVRHLVFEKLFANMGLFRLLSGALALYQRSGAQWVARKSGLLAWMKMEDLEVMSPAISQHFTVIRWHCSPVAL